MEQPLAPQTTETAAFAPQMHFAPSLTTTTLTDSTHLPQPEDHVVNSHNEVLEEHEEHSTIADGTLERLVKTDDVPSEDPNVDDGQQPLGIVESCFPYLARRNHHHHAPAQQPTKGTLAQLAVCGGIKCHAYDEEHAHRTKNREETGNAATGFLQEAPNHAHIVSPKLAEGVHVTSTD